MILTVLTEMKMATSMSLTLSTTRFKKGTYSYITLVFANVFTPSDREPIEWPDSPPRAEENADDSDGDAASNNEDQPALVKRLVKKNSAADSVSP
jgi:hypothetical protein